MTRFCLALLAALCGQPDQPVDVGAQTQLFADDLIVARQSGVTRVLGAVVKSRAGQKIAFWRSGADGRPRPMAVWQLFHTVYHDEARRRFRMWCRGLADEEAYAADGSVIWDRVAYIYCESADGENFHFVAKLEGLHSNGDYNLVVTIDEHDPDPAHRYLIGYDGARPGLPNGACLAHSADGIHFTPYNGGNPVTGRAADFSNQVFFDEQAGLYRLFTRTDFGAPGGVDERRGVRMMTSPNFKRDPANWQTVRSWQFDREGPEEWKRRQPYMMTDWVHRGVHFALLSVYEWPVDYSEGIQTDHFTRHERDINNFYIATSRDADQWDFQWVYESRPFVPRGGNGAWDKDLLFPSSRILTLGDEHWVYYGGCNERHGTPGVFLPKREPGIGLAKLKLDRFIGLRAGEAEGLVVTRPFVLTGGRLQVNVDAAHGELKVGLLDQNFAPLPGFSLNEAHGYRGVDELRLEPRWKEASSLEAIKGREIRLVFALRSAALYAFQVR